MAIRERASVICVSEGKLLTVLLEDPATKVVSHFPPGGAIEAGETPEAAAVRETREETGYGIRLLPEPAITLAYAFPWGGQIYSCFTHFFRADLLPGSPDEVHDASFHRGVEWIALSQLRRHFTYHSELCDTICELALATR